MRVELPKGYKLHLPNKVNEYEIITTLGRGASCFVYLARYIEKDIPYEVILKECNPKTLELKRDSLGVLCIPDDKKSDFELNLYKFEQGYKRQAGLRLNSDLTNSTSNIQGIYSANNTMYIEMTFFNGSTYSIGDNPTDISLYDFFRRMKALATVIGNYHKAGYLHLDIKPENMYALPETAEMVMLFDFDSVIKEDEVKNKSTALSYTKEWAAIEQINATKRTDICKSTDFFAIGEMIFYRVFGRHSELRERRSYSNYKFNFESEIFDSINPKIYPKLNELLKKTLCNVVKNRYQSDDELINQLDEIIKITDPKESYLISSFVNPNSFFIGRDTELSHIHNKLKDNNILFLCGIGGIGKSELAKNYAKVYSDDYDAVFFAVYNENLITLINDDTTICIANFERFPEEKEIDYYHRKIRKLKELCDDRTLLIIDNFNQNEFNEETQKQWENILEIGCKMLITTRVHDWNYPQFDIDIISDKSQLIQIFNQYCETKSDNDKIAVEKIIDYVGGHTLTVELIARQTKNGFVTPTEKLIKLKEHGIYASGKEKILSYKDNKQRTETVFNHIVTLFNIADLNEFQKYVLANMSLIPPNGIDARNFKDWCELEDFNVVNFLIRNGWLERTDDKIKMHPVLSEVILHCLNPIDQYCNVMLTNLYEYISQYTIQKKYENLQTTEYDVAFFSAMAEILYRINSDKEIIADLLERITILINSFGYAEETLKYRKKIVEMRISQNGKEHKDTATALSNLGNVYRNIGNLQDAEKCYKQAYYIRKKLFITENVDVASSLNDIGSIYQSKGNLIQAKQYFEKALGICLNNCENANSEVANSLNNLGTVHRKLGNIDKSQQYYKQSLEIWRKIYGEMHPSVAFTLNNLGVVNREIGELYIAEKYCKEAYEIFKKLFGNKHSGVAYSLNVLSMLYKKIGNFDDAKRYGKEAYEVFKELYGTNHPTTAFSLNNIGEINEKLGNLDEAKQYCFEAYKISKNLYGNNHPTVAYFLNNLGEIYINIGDLEKSEDYCLKAYTIRKELLGEEHPYVANSLSTLGKLYQSKGDITKARHYYEKTLKIRKKLFGEKHPDTLRVYERLQSLEQL